MTDVLKLKAKIFKALKIYRIEEIKPTNKEVKFSFKITPFEKVPTFIVGVEYLPKIDMVRVVASMATTKNLREHYKLKKDIEKNEIVGIFSKPMRVRNFNAMISKDFTVLEGFKFLFPQNMSAQGVYDAVSEAVYLLQDLGELLFQADQSSQVPKVSEASKNMFR